jgi:hypothetical protein
MSGQRQTLPPLAALKPGRSGDGNPRNSNSKTERNATGIARQRRRQRLPTAREPDLQARLLELASGDRSRCRRRWPGGGRGWRRGRRCGGTLTERLFLRRFLRALPLVGLDLRLDRREGLLVVFLF